MGASNPFFPITYQISNYSYMSTEGRNMLHIQHFIRDIILATPNHIKELHKIFMFTSKFNGSI